MPGLLWIAFRNLGYRRLRSALAAIAIMLGTAVVAAAFTTNAAVEESMRASALRQVGNADLVVEALDEEGFPLSVVQAVRALPDVALVAPQVRKRTFFRSEGRRGFVELLGVDPQVHPQIYPFQLASGRPFASPQERSVLLVEDWARRMGIAGSVRIDLMTADGLQPFLVAGLLDEVDASQRHYGGLVRVPLAVAQQSFGLGDRVHLLSLKVKDPASIPAVKNGLKTALSSVYLVRETPVVLEELTGSIRDFQAALLFFSAIALFVGGYLVLNTLSLAIVEQRREIGLLRAAGASPGMIMQMSLVQGLALGVMGAVAGVVLGQALAVGLVLVASGSQGIPIVGVPISWPGVGISFVLGIGVSLVSSFRPAFQAGRISPLEALGVANIRPPERRAGGRLVGFTAVIAIAVFLVLPAEGATIQVAKMFAIFLLFPSVIGISQWFIPPLGSIAAFPLHRVARGVALLAESNIRRERARAGTTVAGFIISLSLIVALANSAASFSTAGQEWAQSLFPGEFVVVSPVDQPPEIADEFRALPGVEGVGPVTIMPVVWQGLQLTAAGVDPTQYFPAFQFQQGERVAAFTEMRRGPSVLISSRLAHDRRLKLGDSVTLRAGDREATFAVSGVVAHSFPTSDNYGAVVIAQRDAEEAFGANRFRFLSVRQGAGADHGELERRLRATAELFGMESTSLAELRGSVGRSVGTLLGLLASLVGIGAIVGCLSVITTMLMGIAQRLREIGILRAEGMTRGQIQVLFVTEGGILGFVGALIAITLGAFLTWVLVGLNRTPEFDPQYVFSLAAALAVLALGVGSASVASFYPAGLAARTNIAEALRR